MVTQGGGPSLVGISGRSGAGKSTAADVLVGSGWVRVKFADPLKRMLRAIGLDDRHIEGDLKEKPCDLLAGQTPRHAMQTLGTEWGRQCIAPDLWTSLCRREILLCLSQGKSVVVDDVRFENEAEVIRALGGSVLRLNHGNNGADGHASEAGVVADMAYSNTGTRAELEGFMRYVFLMRDAG